MRASIFFKDKEVEIDSDSYDYIFQHLLIMDGEKIVGTYRLAIIDSPEVLSKSYTQTKYDISSFINNGYRVLEVGRSCVHPDYRTGSVISCLWMGLGKILKENEIDYILGCVSFDGCDINEHKKSIAYIYEQHLSRNPLYPKAIRDDYDKNLSSMKKEEKGDFSSLPPLFKGYIRAGGKFAKGVVIDREFNTTHLCVIIAYDSISEVKSKRCCKFSSAGFQFSVS